MDYEKTTNALRQNVKSLKNKYGFEKNDFELEAEKKRNSGMKIILTGHDSVPKKKDFSIVERALEEEGLTGVVSEVRESGLSDDEVIKKRTEFTLPEGEQVNKRINTLLNDFDVPEKQNDGKASNDIRNLCLTILALPWYRRFGSLNRMLIDVMKGN